MLAAVLLLLQLWGSGRQETDNERAAQGTSAPLLPLLQRFQSMACGKDALHAEADSHVSAGGTPGLEVAVCVSVFLKETGVSGTRAPVHWWWSLVGSMCLAIPRVGQLVGRLKGQPREAMGWVAGDVAEHHLSILGFFKQLESGQGHPGRGWGLWRSSRAACRVDGATCTNLCVIAAAAPSMLDGTLLPSCQAEPWPPRAAGFTCACSRQHRPEPRLGWGRGPGVLRRGAQGVLAFTPEQASAAGPRASWERGVGRALPGGTVPEAPSPA